MTKYHFGLEKWKADEKVARILSESKREYQVGDVTGKIFLVRKKYKGTSYFVGDIVQLEKKNEHLFFKDLLERKNSISKSANQTMKDDHEKAKEQILATNVNQLFILIAVDQNFSLSKVERFILIFQQKNIDLWIVLTKKDLKPTVDHDLEVLNALYPDVHFTAISMYDKQSLSEFQSILRPGQVGLMIGASGAGKSTLMNALLGEEEQVATNQVRKDRKGRHTTTASMFHECYQIDYFMIDTPGFKGIDSQKEVDANILFNDIIELSRDCKFSNCRHDSEPGCAIKIALRNGKLSQEKWERYCYQESKIATFSAKKRRK